MCYFRHEAILELDSGEKSQRGIMIDFGQVKEYFDIGL